MSPIARLLSIASLVIATSSAATEDLYLIIGGGYTDLKTDLGESSGGSYRLGVGYQIHPQWYMELGYQQLAGDKVGVDPEVGAGFESELDGDALYAGFLGKASGRTGELFYRLGVLNTDIKGRSVLAEGNCVNGSPMPAVVGASDGLVLCEFDEGGVAGVFGVGFDFYLGTHTMLRTEIEHIRGEHGLSTNAAYLGLRYNFW